MCRIFDDQGPTALQWTVRVSSCGADVKVSGWYSLPPSSRQAILSHCPDLYSKLLGLLNSIFVTSAAKNSGKLINKVHSNVLEYLFDIYIWRFQHWVFWFKKIQKKITGRFESHQEEQINCEFFWTKKMTPKVTHHLVITQHLLFPKLSSSCLAI